MCLVGFEMHGTQVKVFQETNEEGGKKVEAKVCADVFNPKEEEQGELCYRGRHIMLGYLACKDLNDEETVRKNNEAAIDSEGWLHSGDKGCRGVNNFIRITGRYKELIKGSGGENIAPVPIEDKLLSMAPAISKAIMIGDKRKYNCILITLKTEGATG